MKLTMSACRAAQPKETRYKLSDGHGLRLVVQDWADAVDVWRIEGMLE